MASATNAQKICGASGGSQKTIELDIGVRKIWDNFPYLRPYIGGGMAFIEAEEERAASASMDENSLGIWIRGGVYWTFDEHFNIGFEMV
jgi:hypothetical protein